MLDDVERRRFLVQPAREDPLPLAVGAFDVDLDEGACQRLVLPRRGGLAGAQPDDDVLDPHRLAGPQRDVADDPVALVQQAEDGDPLRHRRHPCLPAGGLRGVDGHRTPGRLALRILAALAAAERQQDRCHYDRAHAQSGVQGW
jgi:hypothetical protein